MESALKHEAKAVISIAATIGLVWLAGQPVRGEPPVEKPAAEKPVEALSKLTANAVKASMVLERETIRPGETIDLAVTLEISRGWHTYWNGDNDSGFPTEVKLTLPRGLTAGPIKWPVPERHLADGDILDYVYFDQCTLLVPITADSTFAAEVRGEIVAELSWLVCREGCVPGSATLKTDSPFVAPLMPSSKPKADKVATEVKAARELLAMPASKDARVTAKWEGDALVLGFKDSEALTFMPSADGARVADPIKTATTSKAKEPLTLRFKPDQEAKPGAPDKPVVGFLRAKVAGSAKPVNIEIKIDQPK